MAKQGRQKSNDGRFWFLAIFFMVIGLAPIGVLMIIWKLFIQKEKPSDLNMPKQAPIGARTTGTQQSQSKRDPLQTVAKKAKSWIKWGGVATLFWGFCLVMAAIDELFWLPDDPLYYLESILPLLCFTVASGGFLVSGLMKRKQVSRFRNYLAMIGQRSQITISTLASAMGRPADKVRADLSDMLDMGVFTQGFLDYGNDRLVLSADGVEDPAPAPRAEAASEAKPKADAEDAILSEIRAVNDAVTNEKLSAQIDRIGMITAKILDYQRSHPEKAPALHSFLSYYLPTTLKILRAYGQLEAQEVKGANITAAMERIEGMMDKVVEGFEKQLDQLFLGDTMDITTDVEVLERMLAKDGLSGGGLTLNL